MNSSIKWTICLLLAMTSLSHSQTRSRGASDVPEHPQAVGDAGIAWYTTWETGLAEAQRSNRPLFFMSAATTCSGVPGVFWPGYTKTQNSLFANEDFIKASRKFVCVRIETYENSESEKMVRALLNGAFANTSFCVFDPQGKERLSRSGRSPTSMAQTRGRRPGSGSGDGAIIEEMNRIASKFTSKGDSQEAVLEDFNTFRQALNVASADQRLLVFVNADKKDRATVASSLRQVFADEEIVGKFHLNLLNTKSDKAWFKSIKGASNKSELVIIRAGTFGLDGVVMDQLSLTATPEKIKTALVAANKKFASLEDRKTYSSHVQQGRRNRVYFENEIPYGEDRDGDGKIDNQRGGNNQRGGGQRSGRTRN